MELSKASDVPDGRYEFNEDVSFFRQDAFLGLHFRYLRYFHPYVIGTVGQHREPDRPSSYWVFEYSQAEKVVYHTHPGFSVKFGMALELPRIIAYAEFGGGSYGSGHSETNVGLSYPLKPLPTPQSFSLGRSPYTLQFSPIGIKMLRGKYVGDGGLELTVMNRESGREYGFGIMYLAGPLVYTSVLNMKLGWPLKKASGNGPIVFEGTYGIQTLLWLEGDPDFIFPAAYLSLKPSVNLGLVVIGLQFGGFAAYSIEHGAIIGSTYGVSAGLRL